MHSPSIWGILVVAVVVLLLFGRGKISGMMGEVASGIKAFQKGMRDEENAPSQRLDSNTTASAQADAREVEKSKDA